MSDGGRFALKKSIKNLKKIALFIQKSCVIIYIYSKIIRI